MARRALYDRQSGYKQAMEQLAAGKKCREADERADQQRQIYGNVVLVLAGSDTLTNTGTIHGNAALGASDTIDNSGGAITASNSDTFDQHEVFGLCHGNLTAVAKLLGSGSSRSRSRSPRIQGLLSQDA